MYHHESSKYSQIRKNEKGKGKGKDMFICQYLTNHFHHSHDSQNNKSVKFNEGILVTKNEGAETIKEYLDKFFDIANKANYLIVNFLIPKFFYNHLIEYKGSAEDYYDINVTCIVNIRAKKDYEIKKSVVEGAFQV
ncbi:hypothetical protein CR513_40721, partial [Mucuna pruriens]